MQKYLYTLLLVLFFTIPYIYTLDVIDKISIQWFYLSILNLACLLINVSYNRFHNSILSKLFKNNLIILICIYVVFGLSSYFFAINQNEVIVVFSRWINVIFAICNLYFILFQYNNPKKIIPLIIVATLSLEVFATLYQFFNLTSYVKYEFAYAHKLIGLTSNKNVNAASIISKVPFLFYMIHMGKHKTLNLILLFLSMVSLTLISARASFVSLILIVIFYCIGVIIKNKSYLDFKSATVPILTSIFLGLVISNFYAGSKNSISLNNRVATILNQEDESSQSRVRFYKQALKSFKENPILGVGLGNWKIESIKYDNQSMKGYVVQYHVHNDFLQNLAELGLIGLLLFSSIFIQIANINIRQFLVLNKESSLFSFSILLSLGAYFIDSNLNFPQARLINLSLFMLLILGSLIPKKSI